MKVFGEFKDETGDVLMVQGEGDNSSQVVFLSEVLETSFKILPNRKQCFEIALALVRSTGVNPEDESFAGLSAHWLEKVVEVEAEDEKIKEFLVEVLDLEENVRVTEADREMYARAVKWAGRVEGSDVLEYEDAEHADKSVVWEPVSREKRDSGFKVKFSDGCWYWTNDSINQVWQKYSGSHPGSLVKSFFPMKKVSG